MSVLMGKKVDFQSLCYCYKQHLLVLVLLLHAFCIQSVGQSGSSCPVKIENNFIGKQPAVCVGTLVWLQGSPPKGGNGTYSYQWMMSKGNCGEGNFQVIPGATGKDYMVPATAPPKACYRRVVSSGSCTDESNKEEVNANSAVNPIPPLINVVNPTCDAPLGVITVTSRWPEPNITYSIDGINYVNTNGVFSGLKPNVYVVTVKYATGCISPPSVVIVKPLPVLTGNITPSNGVLCGEGANIKLTATGGKTYQWYRDGIKINGATSADYDAAEAGSYTAEIFDGSCKGKTANKAVVVQGVIPTGSITPAQATLCAGSAGIKLTASGGVSYQWYRNDTKIEGATNAFYLATQAGNYTADIFNTTCQGKSENVVAVIQNEPIVFETAATDPNCTNAFGEVVIRNVQGGNGKGFQYSKDNGQNFQNGPTFSNLSPGSYRIVVKDDIGCTSNATITVIHFFTSTLNATTTVSNITCVQSAGVVNVQATGGTAPYQYSVDDQAFQPNNIIGELSAGNHKIKVKDAAGCSVERNFAVAIVNSTLTGSTSVTNATCRDKGAVMVKASGGTPPYVYSLDGGSFLPGTTFNNLPAGNHKAMIKDNEGCTFSIAFTVQLIGVYPNLVVEDSVVVCSNNTVNLTDTTLVTGSDPKLVYSYWKDTIASTPVGNPAAAPAGTYFIKAVNEQGCATIKPLVVSLHTPAEGKIILSGPSIVCFGQTVTLTASNGKSHQWYLNDAPINGATGRVLKAAVAGVYSVAIDDGTCTAFAANKIQVQFTSCASNPETAVFVPTAFTPNKNGANDALRPLLHNIASLQYFEVYNRWGQKVFRTKEIGEGWDGTINGISQPGDTYSWLLQCTDLDGNVIKQSGRSLLIR